MAKIKKSFKNDFKEDIKELEKKQHKKENKTRIIWNFSNIFIFIIKAIGYILLCGLISLGATAIFNSEIREMILSFII